MKYWQLFFLNVILTTPAFSSVSAYFNHNPKAAYTDPYRNISRQGDNLEEVLLKEISLAKKNIYLAVQELRLPLVAQALIQKKKEGLDVRVVLENSYNFTVISQRDTPDGQHEASKIRDLIAFVDSNRNGKIEKHELETRDAIYMLQAAQIPVMDDSFDGSDGSGLMHHKFMIIDGKSTVVSSANFTMSCIHGDSLNRASRGNANSMIQVDSTNFARIFTEEFSQLWGNGKRGNFGHGKTYRGPLTTTVRGTKITVQFSPTSERYNWEESVNGLIASQLAKASKSIVGALFVFSDQNIANVMQARQEAGAQIGLVIEPKFAFREYSELLDLLGVRMLDLKCNYEPDNRPWNRSAREAGMARLAAGDVLHHKFAVIDQKTVVMGSQNWSSAANHINDETLVVIQDVKISEQFAQEYERLKKTALMGIPSYVTEQISKLETACQDRGSYF